ncbi:hypothetical protein CEXT_765751 [Caerostris extrusa]|uniref:Uncharacterized protein n=1 Tax=Caerostris extrusa TaxID=172846 RepID=A0AAV4XEX0_CAEEX|nr:hypothetical protein CEXT_765751 [Caerostris extrusa]
MVCVVIGAASYLLPFSDITVSLSASFCYAPGEMANCHQQSQVKWVVKIRLATMERKKTGQLEIKGVCDPLREGWNSNCLSLKYRQSGSRITMNRIHVTDSKQIHTQIQTNKFDIL